MSTFAGVVRFDGEPLASSPGPHVLHEAGGVRLTGDAASCAEDRGVVLLANARALPAEVETDVRAGRTPLRADELLARYLAEGPAFVDRLRGSFAIAVWDARERRLVLLRDALGRANLVWGAVEGGVAFATRVRELHALEEVEKTLDLGHLAVFFHGIAQLDEQRTVWRGVRRVPARGRLVADARGTHLDRWLDWSAIAPERGVADDEWVERYRHAFRRALLRNYEEGESVGSLLSGGLDSSSIVVELAALRRAAGAPPLETFSARFGRSPSSDEGRFVHAVVERSGVRSTEVQADGVEPFGAAVRAHVAARDEPSYGANLFLNLALTRAAAERGVRVLFDGVDGDSVLGYGLERLTALALGGRWWTLARELRAAAPRVGTTPRDLLASSVLAPLRARALEVLPTELRLRRRRTRLRRGGLAAIRPELVGEHGLVDRVARLCLRPTDLSSRASLLSGLGTAFHGMILEFLGSVLEGEGLRGAYPYFDRDLVELSLALPEDQRLRDGWTRWIQREAGEGLPDEVRWRPWKQLLSRGFADALMAHHRDLLGRLDDPTLPLWQVLEPGRVRGLRDRLLERERADDAFFIGKCLALACWLDPDSLV